MGLLQRLLGGGKPLAAEQAKHAEGELRPGPWLTGDGWISATWGRSMNWWQMGYDPLPYGAGSSIVEACVSAYAQTAAMCPGDHWRKLDNGGRERVTTSALSRIVRRPNAYLSMSDFMLNLVRQLYVHGEAFALALRNDRFEIAELHLMDARQCRAMVAEGGEIFYHLGGNEVVDRRFGAGLTVPARDVLHVRLHTPRSPLKGETPMMAAALDMMAGNVALQQQVAFFTNQAKPSFILSTDHVLTREQTTQLREAWDAQTKGEFAGGTPILGGGTKPHLIGGTAQDAQLAETMKLSRENVALVYRVPLQVLGLGAQQVGSTEALMQSWLASGLGFCLNHVEEAFGLLFGLRGMPDEYLEFDTRALLRSAFKDRMEGLARAVQGGIYAPDEARAYEDLGEVPGGFGAMPRVQQQVVPLDWHDKQPAPTPAVPQLPAPAAEPEEEPDEDAERHTPDAISRRLDDFARLH